MAETKTCPRCGAELPANAPSGICPKCLMRAGLEIAAESHEPASSGDFAATTPQARQFVPPEPNSLAPHFPQLEIRELLGHGGMGAVYKAQQTKLDRLVALKIIRPESADDPAFAERFNREARTLARLNHPNIVAVHDFGEVTLSMTDGDDSATRPLYYFLMEYVDGANLRQLLQGGELKAEQALTIVPQICEALQFAHDEGIVHRDIKPENILVDSKGRVKIADFGLAKLLGATSGEDHTLTGTHQVMGTPRYMAPEQMEALRSVDHRADIYSLGVVFYEMLTGELPMGSFEPPSKKVQVDVRLDEVVLHSLAKEPERRYQHASDIKTDVESILASGPGFRSAGAEIGTGRQHGAPAAIGLSASATEQEAKNADGLFTAVLLILFFGSVGGGWLMFMPWSQVHIETLPQASQQGLKTGISHQLEAEGYRSALPILGATLSLVLFTFTLVKTIIGKFPSAARAMLAAATGITLAITGGLIFCLAPLPNMPEEYSSVLRGFGHDFTDSKWSMRELQILEIQGIIDLRVDIDAPACYLSMLIGGALIVASLLEMRVVLASRLNSTCGDAAEWLKGPAIALRWAAWSSPLTIPALIAMNIGYSSAHSSVSTVLLVVMVLQIILSSVCQIDFHPAP